MGPDADGAEKSAELRPFDFQVAVKIHPEFIFAISIHAWPHQYLTLPPVGDGQREPAAGDDESRIKAVRRLREGNALAQFGIEDPGGDGCGFTPTDRCIGKEGTFLIISGEDTCPV